MVKRAAVCLLWAAGALCASGQQQVLRRQLPVAKEEADKAPTTPSQQPPLYARDVPPVPGPLDPKMPQLDWSQVSAKVDEAVKASNGTSVVSLGIVHDQQLLWTYGAGVADIMGASKGKPTPTSGFRIGSSTKMFTTLMLRQLADKGVVGSIDDPVVKHEKRFRVKSDFQGDVTLAMLAGHTSGLPREAPCRFDCPNITNEEMFKRIGDHIELVQPPGLRAMYSNLGIAVLGRALEAVTGGKKWEDYLEESIIKPLGMVNTHTRVKDMTNVVTAYNDQGVKMPLHDFGWGAPAGQLMSCVADLAKLVSDIFKYDGTPQLLSGEAMRDWILPGEETMGGRLESRLGWDLYKNDLNQTIVSKGGDLDGYHSVTMMNTQVKAAAIILVAGPQAQETRNNLAVFMGDFLVNVLPKDLKGAAPAPAYPAEVEKEYGGNYTGVQNYPKNGTPDTLLNYTGRSSAQLVMRQADLPPGKDLYVLSWLGERKKDAFMKYIPGDVEDTYGSNERLYFQRGDDGKVKGFTLPGTLWGVNIARR